MCIVSVFLSECTLQSILNKNVCKFSELYENKWNELGIKKSCTTNLQTLADIRTIVLDAENRQKSARLMRQPIDRCTTQVFAVFTVASYWYWFPLPWFPVIDLLLFLLHCCSLSSSHCPSTAALALYFALLQYVKWTFLLLVFLGFFFFLSQSLKSHLAVAQCNLAALCTFLGSR